MNKQPKLEIRLTRTDYLIEGLGILLVLLLTGWPAYHYGQLPDLIPKHFNAAGVPDAYGRKSMIWIVPVLGLLMYVGLSIVNRFPHLFNYPKEITQENAKRQYRLATRMIRSLNVAIVASFFYIVYSTIHIAQQGGKGLGIWFVPVFLTVVFGPVIVYLIAAFREGRRS